MGITQAEVDSAVRDGMRWLLAQAITTDNGLAWPETPGGKPDPSLYSGGPGIVPTLLEDGWTVRVLVRTVDTTGTFSTATVTKAVVARV